MEDFLLDPAMDLEAVREGREIDRLMEEADQENEREHVEAGLPYYKLSDSYAP